MVTQHKYPFEFVNAFFISLEFGRDSAPPEKMELQIAAQIKVADEKWPRLQIHLKTTTQELSPLRFTLELVGLFDYVGEDPKENRALVEEFINEKGLNVLWPYITQMIRIITGQMGMNPLETKTPLYFNIVIQPAQQPTVEESKPKKRKSKKGRA